MLIQRLTALELSKVARILFALLAAVGCSLIAVRDCPGQQTYELRADELGIVSKAEVDGRLLKITTSKGTTFIYRRDAQYDSADGLWIAYYNDTTAQVIRWPATNAGNLQIAQVGWGGVKFRYSQMAVRDVPGTSNRRKLLKPQLPTRGVFPSTASSFPGQTAKFGDLLPPAFQSSKLFQRIDGGLFDVRRQPNEIFQLVGRDDIGNPWVLNVDSARNLNCTPAGAYNLSRPIGWSLVAVSAGLVRIQTQHRGRMVAISNARGSNRRADLQLAPISQDARQLWRVSRQDRRGWMLYNAFEPGLCLTHFGGGRLGLQSFAFAANQLWAPYIVPIPTPVEPLWRTVSTEVIANPALADAELQLQNNHRDALIVLLADRTASASPQQIRIEPGRSQLVQLKRDSGATVIETAEVRSSSGVWESRRLVTSIPPTSLYDISVYTEHLQSIAIDRTGKSPNKVEDVNYIPKSVGWLLLPAGADLPASGSLDVYNKALQAKNPGAVRKLDFDAYDDPPEPRPLDQLLKEAREDDAKSKQPEIPQRRRF